jgi:hypothetical protein
MTRRERTILLGVPITLSVAVLVFIATVSLRRAHESANRVKCRNQIRALCSSLELYANEYRGAYPPSLKELITTQDVTPEFFVCPSSGDTTSASQTLAERAADLEAGGHCSYRYLGAGRFWNREPEKILLFEPMSNHRDGFFVVFGDGHAEFITGTTAPKIQAELLAGQNPPRSYKPQPTSGPQNPQR